MQISLINQSSYQLEPNLLRALQAQLTGFNKIWGTNATISLLANTNDTSTPITIPKGHYALAIVDNPDIAGALGYHSLTTDNQPFGKCFYKTALQANQKISSVVSHELLEMVADPYAQLWAVSDSTGELMAFEVCDPVQGDDYVYLDVTLSNYVTPLFFQSEAKTGKFDCLNLVKTPFQVRPGGYAVVIQNGVPTQVFGSHMPDFSYKNRINVRRMPKLQ